MRLSFAWERRRKMHTPERCRGRSTPPPHAAGRASGAAPWRRPQARLGRRRGEESAAPTREPRADLRECASVPLLGSPLAVGGGAEPSATSRRPPPPSGCAEGSHAGSGLGGLGPPPRLAAVNGRPLPLRAERRTPRPPRRRGLPAAPSSRAAGRRQSSAAPITADPRGAGGSPSADPPARP